MREGGEKEGKEGVGGRGYDFPVRLECRAIKTRRQRKRIVLGTVLLRHWLSS